MPREKAQPAQRKAESTDARERGGLLRSGEEAAVMVVERRGRGIEDESGQLANGRSLELNGRRQPSIDGTSRMMREYQVRICERLRVKFPGPTRHSRLNWAVRVMSGLPPGRDRGADIPIRQLRASFAKSLLPAYQPVALLLREPHRDQRRKATRRNRRGRSEDDRRCRGSVGAFAFAQAIFLGLGVQ